MCGDRWVGNCGWYEEREKRGIRLEGCTSIYAGDALPPQCMDLKRVLATPVVPIRDSIDAPPYPKVVPRTLQTTVPWRVVMNHAAPASDLFSATTSQPAPSAPHPVRGKLRSLASSSSPTPAPAAPPPPPPSSVALGVFHTLRPVTGSIVLSYLGAAASPLATSAPEALPSRPEPTRSCAAVPAAAADASAAVIFFQICLPVAGSVTWTKGIGARGVDHGVESKARGHDTNSFS